jgi:hypothetical protein
MEPYVELVLIHRRIQTWKLTSLLLSLILFSFYATHHGIESNSWQPRYVSILFEELQRIDD